MDKKLIYLDWNCIKGIKEPSNEVFQFLKQFLSDNSDKIIIPYSPSHLDDLNKNYDENKERIDSDLNHLKELSNEIIIAKYFQVDELFIGKRNLVEFFHEIREDKKNEKPIETIISELKEELGFDIDGIFEKAGINLMDIIPNDDSNEKTETGELAKSLYANFFKTGKFSSLLEDIGKLNSNFENNPDAFNSLRKSLKEDLRLDPNISNWESAVAKLDVYLPNTLLGKSFSESVNEEVNRYHKEPLFYDYYFSSYNQLGLWGFRPDSLTEKNKFSNSIEDALHSFYGANSDCFITNDKTLYYRSKALFEAFNLESKLIKTFKVDDINLFKVEIENVINK